MPTSSANEVNRLLAKALNECSTIDDVDNIDQLKALAGQLYHKINEKARKGQESSPSPERKVHNFVPDKPGSL